MWFLAGGGDAGALARGVDWARTPLGPPERWTEALRAAVSLVMTSDWPLLLWWGPELIQVYNDAYTPVLGAKHPRAMGQRFRDCWAEVFHILGPMAEQPYRGGPPSKADDIGLALDRRVPREESHFRLAYNPVRDETVAGTGIGGVLAILTEITEQVYGERQLRTLRELATRCTNARTVAQVCELAIAALALNAWDVPFATITADDAHAEIDRESPWGERQTERLELPLASYGTLVVGWSPHRVLDDGYRAFFELVASQIVAAIRSARDYADEQRRAEQLAALDRAKTTFFSNISHEFRTPLTLMLGPTEDALAASPAVLAGDNLATVHRNELRMLRLVNALLDFSRIEAGRINAAFARVDLAALTRSLASSFEAAIARVGLRFEVDTPSVGDDLYVDRDQWEKIVLNLLSNAFKFTLDGGIRVSLQRHGERVVLEVADTGGGIAQDELPRVFERFHRIEGAKARTNEGSGIGLSLVRDLVQLHGGTIAIASELGRGTTVRVELPAGRAHIPDDKIVAAPPSSSVDATFVAEAMRWGAPAEQPVAEIQVGARVLLADDNADMRDYLSRRLREQGFAVEAVGDGNAALASARARRPDLVITDIMMPGLDGFSLIAALRERAATASLPVIVLSARAGEEARIEGLGRGANDYLVKPFSARELIARVHAQLATARLQRVEAETRTRLEAIVNEAPVAVAIYQGAEHVVELANKLAEEVIGAGRLVGRRLADVLPPGENGPLIAAFDRVYQTGETFVAQNFPVKFARADQLSEHLFQMHFVAMRDPTGAITGVFSIGVEVTEVATARAEAERANRAKDEFLALLGHELRNPLAPILTALDILRIRDKGATRELAVIERQAQHLVRLVDDLLDVSRIIQGKVELKRVRLELAQVVARGSVFTIELPLADGRHDTPLQVPRTTSRDASTKRVLLVDDNVDAAEMLAASLEMHGCVTRVAHDGAEALRVAAEFAPDVALLDIGLPVMDGYELAGKMRELLPHVRLIALTGYGQDSDRARTRAAGFAIHLVKPVSLAQVRDAVR